MKTKFLRILTLAPALGFVLAGSVRVLAAEPNASTESDIAQANGDAAKTALRQLDAEIDRIDALVDSAPTPEEKAAAKARLDVLKERRDELRKNYVSARYDQLKADVHAEADRVRT